MTHRSPASRTIRVEQLARVEGEGALYLEIADGSLRDVQLNIYEPPRFFEAFLVGRAHTEPADITARICGICPVAYQMSACAAVEDACGVSVEGHLAELRRLLYCGEWIESHTLHVSMLHAPDFMGVPSAIELAEIDRPIVERALALKKAGNHLVEVIGGRAIHPVNVKVGGFHRLPRREELTAVLDEMEQARANARAVVEWVAGFDFPEVEMDYRFVASTDTGHYPVLGAGFTVDGNGRLPPESFLDEVAEYQVRHSTALHARLRTGDGYLVGPLARYALFGERLHPDAVAAAADAGLEPVVRNPFRSVIVRAVEVLHAVCCAIDLIESWRPAADAAAAVPVPPPPQRSVGHGITEAPRGLLYHRYEIDPDGAIAAARIVAPTSQNQSTIEHDLWHVAEGMLAEHDGDDSAMDDDSLRHRCEVAIRNHDPCISCSAHFLDMTVNRVGGPS